MNEPARLYVGEVMHRRFFPVRYRFAYRVFNLLLDIDRVGEAARHTAVFSHNRFNLLAFHDADHGPRDGSPLRPWIDGVLARFGIDLEGGSVQLLSFPRVLGYVFNPLSVWYCRHRDGSLRAVLLEVANTFGERHGYLLHEQGAPLAWPVRQSRAKCFHVSPFVGMKVDYQFRLGEPGDRLEIGIRALEDQRQMLVAAQVGRAEPFTTRALLRALIGIPFLTLKVMAMIHWQALKIWLRGATFFPKPAPPREEVS